MRRWSHAAKTPDQGKSSVYALVYDLKDSHRDAIIAGIPSAFPTRICSFSR